MVVKTALPKTAVRIDTPRASRQAPFENPDVTDHIGIFHQEVHMVRHDTPGMQRAPAGVGDRDDRGGGYVRQGRVQGEPGTTVNRADRDEKHSSFRTVLGSIEADSLASRGDGCRGAVGHGRTTSRIRSREGWHALHQAGINPAPTTAIRISVRAGINPAPTTDMWVPVGEGFTPSRTGCVPDTD